MVLFTRKGASGFSASNTAEQVTQGIDGSGLTAIVTGSSNGIGAETARVLAMRGVQIVMAVRNTAAGASVKETILKETPSAKIEVLELDLSSMASVRKFAGEFKSLGLPLNILINNAGVMALPYKLSPDKVELQFATNHLAERDNIQCGAGLELAPPAPQTRNFWTGEGVPLPPTHNCSTGARATPSLF